MSRKRPQESDVGDSPSSRLSQKRSRQQLHDGAGDEPINGTPSKRRRQAEDPYEVPSDSDAADGDDGEAAAVAAAADPKSEPEEHTPRKKRGRPPKSATPQASGAVTPSKLRQVNMLVTPVKAAITPRRRQAADRSARRKSARALIQSIVADGDSDEDEGLAREIYESSEEEEDEEEAEEQRTPRAKTTTSATKPFTASASASASQPPDPETPSATTPRRRGRPRKIPPPKSPTPPRDLPPHEIYFEQNKPGRAKTSHNTLASLDLLTHEEYFDLRREDASQNKDPHEDDLAYLESLHESSFPQWRFELAQGFSLCLYGQGSKRNLVAKLAAHLYAADPEAPIVVVNGHVRSLTAREVFSTVAAALDPALKLPAQTTAMVQALSSALTSRSTSSHSRPITILLHSIDAHPLRKQTTQQLLSQLASLPLIRLVATADTPSFPLLWDAAQRTSFNFLFHDATTLQPLQDVELDPVDEVHELLGRKARRVNGKEGVVFVLRSLPENAKKLFELLVIEVLSAMDDDAGQQYGAENPGVEYRMVYNKAVEDFICSSEMAFRTLLKEFHDHQIIESRKDALGTELLSIPFRREELEAILEDLMS
ncbi:origin recognition complex subunit 2-domain-containing protein [Colletotrichum acutatum]|uniref:Origin recognition complex subunit 2 n=1 Tax=Glomerella acutata TaxID=27357 RepID=A0AAD8UGN3_GLOAC|nr:origin recognition complex subunit 2-domain-containing protein [Colletotrichum acutatum]KAK1717507.1 origin recognition complex subunit 2-domain-containing protein [Colletotrichum acutatum]